MPRKDKPRCTNMALMVRNISDTRGLEFITRLAACVTLHGQSLRAIAENLKIPFSILQPFVQRTFDKILVDGKEVRILNPEARKTLDCLEHFRRSMYDETRAREQELRREAKKVHFEGPIDSLGLSEHNAHALKRIRKILGAPSWVKFLSMIYDPNVPSIVIAQLFPEALEGAHDASTWKRALVQPGRRTMSTEEQIAF